MIVGDIIARRLSCEFDIIIPRKLRAPPGEKLAIGAVMEDEVLLILMHMHTLVRKIKVSQEYIEKEKAYQIQEIKQRSSLYRNSQDRYKLRNNKSVILSR